MIKQYIPLKRKPLEKKIKKIMFLTTKVFVFALAQAGSIHNENSNNNCIKLLVN